MNRSKTECLLLLGFLPAVLGILTCLEIGLLEDEKQLVNLSPMPKPRAMMNTYSSQDQKIHPPEAS